MYLLYGLRRTGTNWLQALLQTHYDIEFSNGYTRGTPLHKHDTFHHKCETLEEVDQATGTKDAKFIIIIKHPWSWYLSFMKWQEKCNKKKSGVNSQCVRTYNAFYSNWLRLSRQDPSRVIVVKYEKLLQNTPEMLNKIAEHFGLEKKRKNFQNITKVRQSNPFTISSRKYYLNEQWIKNIDWETTKMLEKTVDKDLARHFCYLAPSFKKKSEMLIYTPKKL